ncbi:hypothetical protein ACFYW8_05850 [Streptomyces sp. NPDC002742]|uniref:hypothetical protein n=1 Tax=Streptomyces sp. NPDC002742 TaxID=3364663 RepID=UPI0036A639D5
MNFPPELWLISATGKVPGLPYLSTLLVLIDALTALWGIANPYSLWLAFTLRPVAQIAMLTNLDASILEPLPAGLGWLLMLLAVLPRLAPSSALLGAVQRFLTLGPMAGLVYLGGATRKGVATVLGDSRLQDVDQGQFLVILGTEPVSGSVGTDCEPEPGITAGALLLGILGIVLGKPLVYISVSDLYVRHGLAPV